MAGSPKAETLYDKTEKSQGAFPARITRACPCCRNCRAPKQLAPRHSRERLRIVIVRSRADNIRPSKRYADDHLRQPTICQRFHNFLQ